MSTSALMTYSRAQSNSECENSSSTYDAGNGAEVYLPWNARPWGLTYQHNAAEIDNLDHRLCSITVDDSSAIFKCLKSFSKVENVDDCVEDPVAVLQKQDRMRKRPMLSEKVMEEKERYYFHNKGKFHRRPPPVTYIQIV